MARTDDSLLDVTAQPFELTERRIDNQQLNLREHAAGETRLISRPLAVFIELTQNCNLHCPMCRSAGEYDSSRDLAWELFDRAAAELFPTAHIVDLRGWGESTVLADFARAVARAAEHRVQLRLVTNGQINRPAIWDFMMRAHAIVAVSCDAADPQLFASLRAGGTIERLRATVAALVDARDRYGAPRDAVHFNTVASLENLHDLPGIVELASDLGVGRVVVHPIVTHLSDPVHLRHDLRRTETAYEDMARRARDLGVIVQVGSAPDTALAIPELVRRPACMHPWSYAYVSYDGGVGFCDHMIGTERYTLGSLRDSSFEQIWNGPDWVAVREQHLSGRISDRFAPCRYSYAHRYIDFEHLLDPDRAAGLLTSAAGTPLTRRSGPENVSVPWTPEMAGIDSRRPPGGTLVPLDYPAVRDVLRREPRPAPGQQA
ncbi:SPASM domain-containing protein [Actinoplanes sp. NPDC048988]|uniref:SPASM domain-containing protein n=1 Tax=Actinoplanes sp. NPDC048988 TaxID=3363901 RepID=UPI00370F9CB1